jgi:hypothetical protein
MASLRSELAIAAAARKRLNMDFGEAREALPIRARQPRLVHVHHRPGHDGAVRPPQHAADRSRPAGRGLPGGRSEPPGISVLHPGVHPGGLVASITADETPSRSPARCRSSGRVSPWRPWPGGAGPVSAPGAPRAWRLPVPGSVGKAGSAGRSVRGARHRGAGPCMRRRPTPPPSPP